MDSLIFFCVSKLSKIKASLSKILCGSFICALLFCFTIFIPIGNNLIITVISFLIISVGIFITFKPANFKLFFKLILLCHVCAFAIGGIAMYLFFQTNFYYYITDGAKIVIENFPVKVLIISAAIIFIILKLSVGFINTHILNRKKFCAVKLHMLNKEIEICALIDTGNNLFEPITNAPVIICEFCAVEKFFDKNIILSYYKKTLDIHNFSNMIRNSILEEKMCILPYSSLGNENGMLIGFKADFAEIIYDDYKKILNECVIGIYLGELGKNAGFSGIISSEILNIKGSLQ